MRLEAVPAEMRRSLYDPEAYQSCLDRIDRLSPESEPRWGRMTVAQMLAHCAEIQEVANGKELVGTPFLLRVFRGLIRRAVLSGRAYPRNLRTHPQYRQRDARVFEVEKARLLAALKAFVEGEGADRPHALFGRMTREEKGWSAWKHLDHHLTQFDV